jgi:hypothetical protein
MGSKKHPQQSTPPKKKTPTFLLELPLAVQAGEAARLPGHLEAGRQFYNAVLSEGQQRLRQMRADPAWQAARAIPRTHPQERRAAFSALREQYGFSEYAFHDLAKALRVSWLAEHLDAVLAQTLATRAYRALNRVCVGKARRVRFKSRGRGLSSIENKRNDTGLRFVLQTQDEGRRKGYLLWHNDQLEALIDWDDPVVTHGLSQRIKYARLLRRRASSPRAQGADSQGERKLAAHRKSLHGRLVHQIVAVGHTIVTEKISYKGWQKRYGKSVGRCAPGMLIDHLRRTGASHGWHPA